MMKEKVEQECVERMEMLNMSRRCINEFKKGNVWESEGIGALYELNDDEKKIVEEFETEHKGYRVYHVIHNMTEFGELYSLLYVSTETSEWEYDKTDLKDGYAFAYVKNVDDEWCSEFGSIGIRPSIGGLVRIS